MTKRCPQTWIALGLALLASGPTPVHAQAKLGADEARKIGVEAVVYGLPLVVMEMRRTGCPLRPATSA